MPSGPLTLFALRTDGGFVGIDAPLAIVNPFDPELAAGPQELVLYVRAPRGAKEGGA